VKPGYKRTEAGVLPENWQVETISHLLEDKSILGHLDGNHGELIREVPSLSNTVCPSLERTILRKDLLVLNGVSF